MSFDEMITSRLNMARPDRYRSFDWVDDVAESIDIDEIDLRVAAAEWVRSKCRKAEGEATKSGNRMFRHFHKTGQLPLEWESVEAFPISIENVVVVDGKTKTLNERVKLGAATASDFSSWAEAEKRVADRDYQARLDAVAGAREIASRMKAGGFLTFSAWARTAPVEGEEGAA